MIIITFYTLKIKPPPIDKISYSIYNIYKIQNITYDHHIAKIQMHFKKGIFKINGERIILIQEYLQRNRDENRSVTIRDIQNELAWGGIGNVSPITIRHDIDKLSNMGYDFSEKKGAHNTAYYSMSNKGFTFNDIRFIVDSVSINKFLSDDQKRRPIKKFEGMCSDAEIRQLISRVEIGGNTASQRDLLTNLD